MSIKSEAPTQGRPKPATSPNRQRFREITYDVKETILVMASFTWFMAGVVVFIGAARILSKVW